MTVISILKYKNHFNYAEGVDECSEAPYGLIV